jgi:signal transduction histidine kinase/CheY-like chemotaxis protein
VLARLSCVALCLGATATLAYAQSAGHDHSAHGHAGASTATSVAAAASADPSFGLGFFTDLLRQYTPRRLCMNEESSVIWLHLITDGLIAAAYFTIPIALLRFVRKRTDLAFNWMFVCFAIFILACGLTHVMNIVAMWTAIYRVDGLVKAVTAAASVGTATALWRLVPVALLVPSPAQLRAANDQLASEIVERTRAEDQLRQARDELEQRVADRTAALTEANANERAARAEAEHAGRMKDEFLSTLSHELRTPLNAILGWSQIMQRRPDDPALAARALDVIERNARAQARIIEDLLDMSRIISGKIRLTMLNVDLRTLVVDSIEGQRPTAQARGVSLELHTDANAREAMVLADPDRVRQILWNLLSNAIKFTPSGGRVDVRLDVDAGAALATVNVSDTGEGIDPAFLPFVFDRFRQADSSSTRRHGGLGLGLSIVKQLVELHGGKVRAESDGPGRGARFEVSLPLRSVAAARVDPQAVIAAGIDEPLPGDAEAGVASKPKAAADRPRLDGLRALVVDDEPDARELLQFLLEAAGASATLAGSAREALQLLGEQPFDVLVSDIGMPGENGYDLIHHVRSSQSNPRLRQLPAIALTAYARSEDRVQAIRAGFQTHLTKPINPTELLTVVAATSGRDR